MRPVGGSYRAAVVLASIAAAFVVKIWLDDIREPPDYGWVWASDFSQFVYVVKGHEHANRWAGERIELISFDHDLGVGPSGYDCIKWLAEFDQRLGLKIYPPDIAVHSANPVGAENIRKYDEWYRRETVEGVSFDPERDLEWDRRKPSA